MKPHKPNWRKKYEETVGLLKLCRDGNEILKTESEITEKELADSRLANKKIKDQRNSFERLLKERPIIEKIIERTGPCPFDKILTGIWLIAIVAWGWAFIKIEKLQEPISKPYEVPVLVQGGVSDEVFNSLGLELISCKSKLMDCNQDYRRMRREGCKP